ncbi:unnamed protein product [Lactuca saligna]|uniref:Uncharacterized protein n=1 Tax=Lactuca saligna TaxID=75948 RepID=A0AA35Z4E3_LACSI|nr:unnamed protein product [Lactuca saligna]
MLDEAAHHLYISLCHHVLMSPTFPIGYIFCPVELKAKGFCCATLFFDIQDFLIHIHHETRWFCQKTLICLTPQLSWRRGSISSDDLFNLRTLSSWMSSARARYLQDARLAVFEVSSARLAVSEVSSASSRLQKSL